jgi:hypothetical protein
MPVLLVVVVYWLHSPDSIRDKPFFPSIDKVKMLLFHIVHNTFGSSIQWYMALHYLIQFQWNEFYKNIILVVTIVVNVVISIVAHVEVLKCIDMAIPKLTLLDFRRWRTNTENVNQLSCWDISDGYPLWNESVQEYK